MQGTRLENALVHRGSHDASFYLWSALRAVTMHQSIYGTHRDGHDVGRVDVDYGRGYLSQPVLQEGLSRSLLNAPL
jgi:hypothetical protein